MRCLEDKTLSVYLDNELDKEMESKVKEHVSSCKRCSRSLGILKTAREMLKGSITPIDSEVVPCLDEETIGAYVDHLLDESNTVKIEKHLSTCRNCLHKFMVAREMVYATNKEIVGEVPAKLIKKAKELIQEERVPAESKLFELGLALRGTALRILNSTANTVQLLGSGMAAMKPIPVRDAIQKTGISNETEGVIIHEKRDGMDFRFEVVAMDKENCRVRLTIKNVDTQMPRAGLRVNLSMENRMLQSQPTDKHGEVIMENVPIGDYLIKVLNAHQWKIPLSLRSESKI